MKLYFDKRLSDPTYYVQIGIRNGKKVTSKNIAKIGKHSQLLKDHPDPLAYAKEYVRHLNEEKDITRIQLTINLQKKLDASDSSFSLSSAKNIGYLIPNRIYQDLNLSSFLMKTSSEYRISFDFPTVCRILILDCLIEPRSKLQTVLHLHNYFEDPSFDYQHVMRAMDILSEHYDEFIAFLFDASNKIVKRNTSTCFYDCTNYYFEIEQEDEDYIDEETGEIIRGLRKYGVCKDHKPNPIIEMGLFMDRDGIPLSMCLTSRNENEQTTALPLEDKLIRMLKGKQFIYCADAGLGSYNIRKFNSMGGRAFVITQSIKKLPDTLKESVFNDCDYRLLSNDSPVSLKTMQEFDKSSNKRLYEDRAYKIIDASRDLEMEHYEEKILKNGKKKMVRAKGHLEQKLIITFSRKMMEYQRSIRNGQIQRAKKLLENLDPEKHKKGPNDVTRFIKKKGQTKDKYELDENRIREEEKYDGFYAVATNLNDKATEILRISEERNKIEECFRLLKSDFEARPARHRTREHLIAHFMICYASLMIYRLLEVQLNKAGLHLTTQQITETLKNMNVTNIDDVVYKALYTNSKALEAMMTVYPMNLDREWYLKSTLGKNIKR